MCVTLARTIGYAYTLADRQSGNFTEIWDYIKTSDGLDGVDDVGRAAGASKVATWFRRTRQDSNLYMFFDVDECAVEVSRRQEDAEGRFLPLFEGRYRDAYPSIAVVLKKSCDGGAAAQFTTSMAIQLQNTQKLDGPIASDCERLHHERSAVPGHWQAARRRKHDAGARRRRVHQG